MNEEKRISTRLPVPSRSPRDLDAYGASAGGGSAGGGPAEPPAMNVIAAVWRRKGVVLACLILALGGGVVWLMRATPMYSSNSIVLVQQAASAKRIDSSFDSPVTGSNGYLYTQCQLIQSTVILSRAVDEPGVADARVLRETESPVGYLKGSVAAVPSKLGELITVSTEAKNPEDAATIVNGVVAAYQDFQSKQSQSSAVQVAAILQKEVASHTAEIKAENEQMQKIRRENPDLLIRIGKSTASVERISQLNTQLGDAQGRAEELHQAVTLASAADPADLQTLHGLVDQYQLSALLPGSSVPTLASMYGEAKLRIDLLTDAHVGPASEQMQRAQSAVDRIGAQLAQATRQSALSCVTTIRSASNIADAKVKQLQSLVDNERNVTMGLSGIEAEYEQLQEEKERNEHQLDALDEQLKRITVTEDYAPITISVLETAKPNPVPVEPRKSKILGLATAAGLLAGLGAAMLLDRVDQRLRSVEEIGTLLDAPILGVVPRIVRRVLPGEAGREIQLRPRSGVAEAFRTVRTAIYFGGVERAAKTILVTSPTPGDGKSTCISNLAIAVSQAGRRVLLIDADCRRPVQHKTFKLGDGVGLTSVLTGTNTLAEAIQHTDVERLDVLPCGPLPHNPAELLDSQALLDLLAETARDYDQVLIDSPPVTLVSDARVLAASCDAAFLVLRSERSTRRGATLAWNALSSVGANLLGVVVNDLARQKGGYGDSYYGYGRYGYAPAAKTNGELNGHNGEGKSVVVAD